MTIVYICKVEEVQFSGSRSYDPVGNVSSVSTTQATVTGQSGSGGSETQNFCYDEENRLVWAGNSGTQPDAGNGTCGTLPLSSGVNGAGYTTSYTYNHLGKIWSGQLSGKGPQQQYLYCNGTPHAVTGLYPVGTTCSTAQNATASYSASYNAWGDVTSRITGTTTAQLWYDMLDHFVQWGSFDSSNQKQVNEQYVYDASGSRVLRRNTSFINNGAPTTSMTVYAFGLEEHTYTGSGSSTGNTYYYSFAGRLIGQWDGNAATQYDLTDAQGSVLAAFSATTGTTSVLGNQLYDPYGNSRAKTGTLNTSKGYTGQYNDSATGLDYYNARYYDPAIARFMAPDTVQGNAQGMDPYDYVGGNPETKTDPTGNRACGPGSCGDDYSPPPAPMPPPALPPVRITWTSLPTVTKSGGSGSGNPKIQTGGNSSSKCNPGSSASSACNSWAYQASQKRSSALSGGLDLSYRWKMVGFAVLQLGADLVLLQGKGDTLRNIQLSIDILSLVIRSLIPNFLGALKDGHTLSQGMYGTIMTTVSWISGVLGVAEGIVGAVRAGNIWAEFVANAIATSIALPTNPLQLVLKMAMIAGGPMLAGFLDTGANVLWASANTDLTEENRQNNMNIVDWCTQYGKGSCGTAP